MKVGFYYCTQNHCLYHFNGKKMFFHDGIRWTKSEWFHSYVFGDKCKKMFEYIEGL